MPFVAEEVIAMVSFNRGSTVCTHNLPRGGVDHIFIVFLKCGTVISDHNVQSLFELPPSQLEVGNTIVYNITSITRHAH